MRERMMAATTLGRIDVDEITLQAREVRFGETLLRLVAFLLIGTGKVAGYGWLVPVWCALAVREGWREVHPPKPKVTSGPAGAR
jgi:hypothetical protein